MYRTLMRAVPAAMLLAACAAASGADPDPAAQPYTFRSLQLGMSLAEFKAAPPPVDDPAEAKASCLRVLDPLDGRREVFRCAWTRPAQDGHRKAGVIRLGEIPVRAYYFVFFARNKGESVALQQITLAMPGSARARAFRRLSEKFGQPDSTDVDDNVWSARWSNGISSVCLRSSTADGSTSVTYLLRPAC